MTDSGWVSILALLEGALAMVASHVGILRTIRGTSLLRSWLVAVFIGLSVALAVTAWYGRWSNRPLLDCFFSLVANATAFTCLGYGYFHFVNMGETARRIRILWELYESIDGLTYDGILSRYNSAEMLEHRINRLANMGQIALREGRIYGARNSVMIMARILSLLKQAFLGRREVDTTSI